MVIFLDRVSFLFYHHAGKQPTNQMTRERYPVKRNPTLEDVARRAYELFLARGAQHGADVNDWLAAERELRDNGDAPPRSRLSRSNKSIGKVSVLRSVE